MLRTFLTSGRAPQIYSLATASELPWDSPIAELIACIQDRCPLPEQALARRRAIEILAHSGITPAIETIALGLDDDEPAVVNASIWALGELNCQHPDLLEAIAQQLDSPMANPRLVLHTLALLGYRPALARIGPWVQHAEPTIRSAAIAAVYRLTGEAAQLSPLLDLLRHSNLAVRRAALDDLARAGDSQNLGALAQAPLDLSVRLRALRRLADHSFATGQVTFAQIEPILDELLRDEPPAPRELPLPDSLTLEAQIDHLYHHDPLSRMAARASLGQQPESVPYLRYALECNGWIHPHAHYPLIQLLAHLQGAIALPLLLEVLTHQTLGFTPSRIAAAWALANLGVAEAIAPLRSILGHAPWELRYVALIALARLGDRQSAPRHTDDPDWLVRSKALSLLT